MLLEGWDIIFTPLPGSIDANYSQICESVDRLLLQAHLLRDDVNETFSNRAN